MLYEKLASMWPAFFWKGADLSFRNITPLELGSNLRQHQADWSCLSGNMALCQPGQSQTLDAGIAYSVIYRAGHGVWLPRTESESACECTSA